MKLCAPRLLLALTLILATGNLHAQERTASQPFSGPNDVTSPALLRKISYLTQVKSVLEAQLNACRNGLPMPESFDKTIEDNGDFASKQSTSGSGEENSSESSEGTSTRVNMHYASQTPSAPRRTGGVIQQAAEPKLTCEDYSNSYFSRHPAMAAVCGKTAQVTQPAAAPLTVAPSPTTVSASATVSTSARARILGISATTPAAH